MPGKRLRNSNLCVIFLQSARLSPKMLNPGLSCYIIFIASPAGDHAHRVAAFTVSKSLQFSLLPFAADIKAVALKGVFDKQIDVCLIFPPRSAFCNADIMSV